MLLLCTPEVRGLLDLSLPSVCLMSEAVCVCLEPSADKLLL